MKDLIKVIASSKTMVIKDTINILIKISNIVINITTIDMMQVNMISHNNKDINRNQPHSIIKDMQAIDSVCYITNGN